MMRCFSQIGSEYTFSRDKSEPSEIKDYRGNKWFGIVIKFPYFFLEGTLQTNLVLCALGLSSRKGKSKSRSGLRAAGGSKQEREKFHAEILKQVKQWLLSNPDAKRYKIFCKQNRGVSKILFVVMFFYHIVLAICMSFTLLHPSQ